MIVVTKSGKPVYACLTEKDAKKYLDDVEEQAVIESDAKEPSLRLPIRRYNSLWLDACPTEYKCYEVESNVEESEDESPLEAQKREIIKNAHKIKNGINS